MTSVRVVAAVIRRGDTLLVGRRPEAKRHGGMWEFPGGKIDPGETPEDAARRELAEELALSVTAVGRTARPPALCNAASRWATSPADSTASRSSREPSRVAPGAKGASAPIAADSSGGSAVASATRTASRVGSTRPLLRRVAMAAGADIERGSIPR